MTPLPETDTRRSERSRPGLATASERAFLTALTGIGFSESRSRGTMALSRRAQAPGPPLTATSLIEEKPMSRPMA